MSADLSAFRFRPGRPEDVDDLVQVHLRAFPGYTLALAGPRILKMFYGFVLNRPDVVTSVIEHLETGRSVGCAFAVTDEGPFWKEFYRRYRIKMALEMAWRVWVTPALWPKLLGRFLAPFKARLGLSALPEYSAEDRQKWPPDRPEKIHARLLSAGIDPEWQGRGLSRPLWRHRFEQLHERGIEWVQGSTFIGNYASIAVQTKSGLVVEKVTPGCVTFTGRIPELVGHD